MILIDLIEFLETKDPDKIAPAGFNNPHSYRGSHAELFFEPTGETTIGMMLSHARDALDNTYTDWMGGEYKMGGWVDTHIASRGETGDAINLLMLRYMLGEIVEQSATNASVTEEDFANARLIAAAPDLLKACKKFVEVWTKTGQCVKLDVARRLAEQAIEKAAQL